MSNNYQFISRQPSSTASLTSRNSSSLQKLLIAGASVNNQNNSSNTNSTNSSANASNNVRSYSQLPMAYERTMTNLSSNNSQTTQSARKGGTKLVYPTYADMSPKNPHLYAELNAELLKKQEQEIQSQLSPSFWARLNEATKPASYSNVDYTSSGNNFPYTKYAKPVSYFSTPTASTAISSTTPVSSSHNHNSHHHHHNSTNNNYSEPASPKHSEVNPTLNNLKSTLYSAYALKMAMATPSSPSNTNNNNSSNNNNNQTMGSKSNLNSSSVAPPSTADKTKSSPRAAQANHFNSLNEKYLAHKYDNSNSSNTPNGPVSVPVQHQTRSSYENTNTSVSEQQQQLPLISRRLVQNTKVLSLDESPKYKANPQLQPQPERYSSMHMHSSNGAESALHLMEPKMRASMSTLNLIAPQGHLNQSRSQMGINTIDAPSSRQLNNASSIQISLGNNNEAKGNSNDANNTVAMTTVYATRPETAFVRSKSLAPSDRNRLKSFLINTFNTTTTAATPSSTGSATTHNTPTHSKSSKTIPKSIVIRSRIQNYYKDFLDDLNTYSSNLSSHRASLSHADLVYRGYQQQQSNENKSDAVVLDVASDNKETLASEQVPPEAVDESGVGIETTNGDAVESDGVLGDKDDPLNTSTANNTSINKPDVDASGENLNDNSSSNGATSDQLVKNTSSSSEPSSEGKKSGLDYSC